MSDSLQDQLAQTKRAHILGAAAHLFAEKGFHATTVRDVARAAGVADGTIYNYFENKDALLLGLFDQMNQSASDEVDPEHLSTLDLRSFLKLYIQQPLRAFEANDFALFRVIMSEIMVNRELGERFSQQILEPMICGAEAFMKAWGARNGVAFGRSDLSVRIISSLIIGALIQRVLGDEVLRDTWDDLPDRFADLLLEGLQPYKA